MERKLETKIQPMDKVRIVRHPQRICLRDILENVYDNFTEIGGQEEHSIDPSMLIARATITRRRGKEDLQPAHHGHRPGKRPRRGIPQRRLRQAVGQLKALQYMKVAETEGIPIHTYVFTPGSFPSRTRPARRSRLRKNLYEMAGLTVPMVAVFSEGGSGGAEAISLADRRLMLSHGYYSVISPKALRPSKPPEARPARHPELIERCATSCTSPPRTTSIRLYRQGSFRNPASARARTIMTSSAPCGRKSSGHGQTVLSVRSGMFRGALLRRMSRDDINLDEMSIRWHLSQGPASALSCAARKKIPPPLARGLHRPPPLPQQDANSMRESWGNISARIKYALITKHQRKFAYLMDEMTSEMHLLKRRLTAPFCRIPRDQRPSIEPETVRNLTTLSDWDEESESRKGKWTYISPRAREDRAITCPNAGTHGCLDLWSPDLYGEFAGVCTWCGHHFPMEYQWFVKNVFDEDSVREFNGEVEASNPLQFEGFDARLAEARERTKLKSGCITFEAKLDGTKMIVALFAGTFRGGSVGSAEGTKFVEAAELAMKKRYPLRLCTARRASAFRKARTASSRCPAARWRCAATSMPGPVYGPVRHQFLRRAGGELPRLLALPVRHALLEPRVRRTRRHQGKPRGIDIEPHYHSAYKALARGHIQGVWDRREARANLKQVLLTMGGRNLYYR